MVKNIAEKVPGWVERFLLPSLDARIRTVVRTEIDRVMKFEGTLKDIDKRLTVIERNPLIIAFNNISVQYASRILEGLERKMGVNPLTTDELRLRKELTIKLDSGTINPDEARQLRDILNKELDGARATNDILAVFAILFLLGLVIAVLSRG